MFIYFGGRERERERASARERAQGRGRERGGQRMPSRVRAVSVEPDAGLKPTIHEIMT